MSRFGRFVYRLERSPWTCALHYGLRVWWPGMVRFRPDAKVRNQPRYRLDKLATLAFAVVLGAVAYRFGGGLLGALTAVVVPFVVFTYFIAVFVYLHHTHPDIPFFDVRAEWSPAIGQLACTTVVRCSKLSELLTHNILIHTPHHVDTRIPFYRLKQAYNDLDRSFHEHLHEYRFSIARVRSIFRTCQLYDFDTKTWYTFRAARDLLDAGAPAARPVAA
jgi:omega-6 fatty acid desaturase (delta-12 desaturase)